MLLLLTDMLTLKGLKSTPIVGFEQERWQSGYNEKKI